MAMTTIPITQLRRDADSLRANADRDHKPSADARWIQLQMKAELTDLKADLKQFLQGNSK